MAFRIYTLSRGGILCNLMLFNIFCFRITATRATLIGNKPQAPHMRALHDQDDDDDDLRIWPMAAAQLRSSLPSLLILRWSLHWAENYHNYHDDDYHDDDHYDDYDDDVQCTAEQYQQLWEIDSRNIYFFELLQKYLEGHSLGSCKIFSFLASVFFKFKF